MGSAGQGPPRLHKGDSEQEAEQQAEAQSCPSGVGQRHSQHHEAGEVLEGVVRHVADAVEGQGHGLQGREVVEGPDGDLGECIVVQPQVAEAGQPLEAPLGDQGDEVGIQAPGGREGGEDQSRPGADQGLGWAARAGQGTRTHRLRGALGLSFRPGHRILDPLPHVPRSAFILAHCSYLRNQLFLSDPR